VDERHGRTQAGGICRLAGSTGGRFDRRSPRHAVAVGEIAHAVAQSIAESASHVRGQRASIAFESGRRTRANRIPVAIGRGCNRLLSVFELAAPFTVRTTAANKDRAGGNAQCKLSFPLP
jgi:hypothetical protein